MIDYQTIERIVLREIAALDPGMFIVGLQLRPGNVIVVEIDKEGSSVSIAECVRLSRKIEQELNLSSDNFSLEVSSAGIDRPLRHLKQFRKHIGRGLVVKMVDTQTRVEGLLQSATEDGIVIETREKVRIEGRKKKEWVVQRWPIQYPQIKEAKLVITF